MSRDTRATQVRCAIYTRKSTSEGLDQDFNSLDAQRESAEAFITSHRHEGWFGLAQQYADGGFSGGDMDRPGLKRLLADIEAGQIDCVVVYKVDRLSRSLLDFARIIQIFEQHDVSFVSVTQQFNTTHSMGRLTLNILLSFAQFEREMISERTRDKMAAARRKGKYVGGPPILGYDIVDRQLEVNPAEAEKVRRIFEIYLEQGALLPAVTLLERQGFTTKRWTTKRERTRGGRPFEKTSLHNLLTNVAYIGKVCHQQTVYEGQHEAIVDAATFRRVQQQLRQNQSGPRQTRRSHFCPPLKGLLFCSPCECPMIHSHVVRRSSRQYRYYLCSRSQKRGSSACPSQPVPAAEIERFVVEQIAAIGRDPGLVGETLAKWQTDSEKVVKTLNEEAKDLSRELGRLSGEMERLAEQDEKTRLEGNQRRLAETETRLREIQAEIEDQQRPRLDPTDICIAFADFETWWAKLPGDEQVGHFRELLERVNYNGKSGAIEITLNPVGIKNLQAQRERKGSEE